MSVPLALDPAAEFARPPWTADQVASLNAYQQAGVMHEFTCGDSGCRAPLVAAEDGWHCLHCGYTQDWAHHWMADWSWQRGIPVRYLGNFASSGHRGPGTMSPVDLPLKPP